MSRIDKAFCSSSWESIFDKPILQALSSSTSNHCPLLIIPHSAPPFWPKFRFEEFWAAILDFKDTVLQSWSKDTPTILNHMMTLHVKLGRVAKDLRAWSRGLIPHLKLSMAVCREVILQLETAQEQRNLLPSEIDFIQKFKTRLLGLAAVEKNRARQKSRITRLRKGDANTKYFHLMANLRKQKNHILALQVGDTMVISQNEKQEVVYSHFQSHIGTHVPRSCFLNLDSLEWQPKDLSHLECAFTKEEIKKVVLETPKEKAPGPDGFIELFFSSCWDIIKDDLIRAVNQFYHLN
jgi:hypothetical protein